jgi:hypothetical protein
MVLTRPLCMINLSEVSLQIIDASGGNMRNLMRVFVSMHFAVLPNLAFAQERNFEDWFFGITRSGAALYAATVNDSGRVLGQYCYQESNDCVYLLGITTSCTQGNKYPVLVNSNIGSSTMSVYCNGRLGESNNYQYVFTDFKSIHDTVLKAMRVGFAFPLQSDDFTVIRFSLNGSNEAIAAMRKEVSLKPTRSGTRDQRL